jgi:glycosyl transferase family 25
VKLLEFFPRTRIINLPARRDRRRETTQEFARCALALDPSGVAFFDAISPVDSGGFPSPGVRGCFLSHLAVVEEARDARQGHLLVLEDDIAFSREVARHGQAAVEALGRLDWDLAFFGHALPRAPGPIAWLPAPAPMTLAHFYAVNARTLAPLAAFLRRVLATPPGHPDGGPMHYDGALNTFRCQHPAVVALALSRSLGYQRPSRTDLHEVSSLDRHGLLQPVASLLRGVKRAYLSRTR